MTQVLKYLASLLTYNNTDTPGEWVTDVNGIPLVRNVGVGGAASGRVVTTLTPVLDTNIYADGDILFDTIVMAGVFGDATGSASLTSIHVLDEDDQGQGFDLIFFNALTSLGTFNVAPSISDANARNEVGRVNIATSDFIDQGGSRIANIGGLNLVMTTGATTLWVAGITRGGTPTYSASGLKFKFGFSRS